MPKKKAAELGALQMSRLLKPGTHAVGAVVGLKLKINDAGAWSWVLRATVAGKNRDMRLGGFPDMTPAQARDKDRQGRLCVPHACRSTFRDWVVLAAMAARSRELLVRGRLVVEGRDNEVQLLLGAGKNDRALLAAP